MLTVYLRTSRQGSQSHRLGQLSPRRRSGKSTVDEVGANAPVVKRGWDRPTDRLASVQAREKGLTDERCVVDSPVVMINLSVCIHGSRMIGYPLRSTQRPINSAPAFWGGELVVLVGFIDRPGRSRPTCPLCLSRSAAPRVQISRSIDGARVAWPKRTI